MAEAKVIIKGENNITSAVKSAKQDLSGFQSSASKLGSTLKTALNVSAIVLAVKALGNAISGCFNDFSKAERSYKQLAIALNDTSGYEKVVENISALSRQTLSSKEDIESMVSELAALGKSADEINLISDAAVALSNVTGKDLNSSMTTLLNTYNGTTTALNKLGIDTSDLTKEELSQGAAVELVKDKFSALSEQVSSGDMKQSIKNIGTTLGDLKQHIGGIFSYSFSGLFSNIDKGFQGVYGNITKALDWIAATIKNFPSVIKALGKALGETILTIFSWDYIKASFRLMADNITTVINGLIQIIPKSIPQIFSFIYNKALSLIDGVVAWLLDKAESALEAIVNFFARTKLGQWLGAKETTVNLGSEALSQKASERNAAADAAAKDLANNASEIWDTVKDTSKEVWNRTKEFYDEQFGETWREFGNSFVDIVKPTFEEIQVAAEASSKAVEYITDDADEIVDVVEDTTKQIKKTFLDKLTDKIANLINPYGDDKTTYTLFGKDVFEVDNEQASAAATSLTNTLISNLGEAGTLISNLAQNMSSMGPVLGAIVTALEYVIQGFGEVMGSVLDEFVEYGLEPIKEIGRVIADVLMPIMDDIMPSIEQSAKFLIGIFDMLGAIIKPIVSFISSFLTPLLSGIVAVLQILEGPLKLVAKGLVTVAETLGWMGDWIRHIVASIVNWLASWIPWMNGTSDPGRPGNLGDRIQSSWNTIDSSFENMGITDDGSTSTAVQNASYSGATSVTINIYQEAPVVGEGGMLQFAQMIRDQFENLAYYGV